MLAVGSVRLQISAFATPCAKNAQWFSDGQFRRIDHNVAPGRSRAYALVSYPNRLWVLDTASGQQAYSLATDGLLPADVAVNPKTGRVYVTNQGSQIISVLERFGIQADGPLTARDYAGLPMPAGLWE